jgi:spore coat protein A
MLSRRNALKLALVGGAATAAVPLFQNAASARAKRPPSPRFQVPLPIPPVLTPVRVDASGAHYEIEQREAGAHILPGKVTTVWSYNGIVPGPTIKARRGVPVSVRHANRLRTPTVVHLHGGRTPSASDGFPTDMLLPVGFSAADFPICTSRPGKAARVAQDLGSTRTYVYPNDQRAATLWYHDHCMASTGQAVYMGLAGFYLIEDDEEQALGLPQGAHDIPLMICVRQFDEDGALAYSSHGHTGAEGDVVLVNGAPWPRLKVERRKYRFRLLNACNATVLDLALSNGEPLIQIATDGGLLPGPVVNRSLPLSMAERVEVVIDFSRHAAGDHIILRNLNGKDGLGEVMRFDVEGPAVADAARVPAVLGHVERLRPEQAVRTREFRLGARPQFQLSMPPIYWSINGLKFDPDRVDATPKLGEVEIWRFIYEKTIFPTSAHPPHIHMAHYQLLERNGHPPLPHESGWKDTVGLVAGEEVTMIVRFDGYRGRYLIHCHNLEHEDHDMMARFDVI